MRSFSVALALAFVSERGFVTASKVEFPKFWSFSFHTSGDSDDRYVKFSFQELDTWGGGAGWYDRGEILVEYGHAPCNPSIHYFAGMNMNFSLSWWPRGCGPVECRPYTEGLMSPPSSTAMTFPTPSGLNDTVAGTWVESPLYFDQYELTTGEPCALFSHLDSSCTDEYPPDRDGQGCWYLPGQRRDLYIADGAGHPAGLATEMVGSRVIDWYGVTDLCFSQNASTPGTLPPWDSLVGIAFDNYDPTVDMVDEKCEYASAGKPFCEKKLIPVLEVDTSLSPLGAPCGNADSDPDHSWDDYIEGELA